MRALWKHPPVRGRAICAAAWRCGLSGCPAARAADGTVGLLAGRLLYGCVRKTDKRQGGGCICTTTASHTADVLPLPQTQSSPHSEIKHSSFGLELAPTLTFSSLRTVSRDSLSITRPNTTCWSFNHSHLSHVKKN